MEKKKSNVVLIVILIVLVIALLGACVYLFIDNQNKEMAKDNNSTNKESSGEVLDNSNDNIVEIKNDSDYIGRTYRSTDGKFILKIIREDEIKPSDEADIPAKNAKLYAYVNDHIFGIDNIESDGKNTAFSGVFYESPWNVSTLLVDLRDNTLIVCPDYESGKYEGDEVFTRFVTGVDGLEYAITYLNIDAGEFYIRKSFGPSNRVYTKDWKELGWFSNDNKYPEYDNEGVYVYENYSLDGAKIKYDAKGNKIG